MPFRSTSQQRWAHATDQPFARRWDKETDFSKLPKRVKRIRSRMGLKGCTCKAGPPIAAPAAAAPAKGGSLGPGITRIRGNLCNVHGKYGPCDAALSKKKPKGGKGRAAAKPKKTDQQRAVEREQRAQARQVETTRQQAQNLTKISDATNMGDDLANLDQFAQGKPLDQKAIDTLAKQGLLEIGSDGTPRKSEQANVLLNAAKRGDVQGARDAASRARDQVTKRGEQATARTARTQAAAERHAATEAKRQATQQARAARLAKRAGGGGQKQPAAQPAAQAAPSKRAARLSSRGSFSGGGGSSGGGSSAAPKKPAAPKPSKPPAKQIAPALVEAADALSAGGQIDIDQLRNLIRNGMARVDRNGMPVLTAAGLNATKKETRRRYRIRLKEQTAQQRAMFAHMGGGGGRGSGGGAAGAGKGGGGAQQATLWNKNAEGKRVPQAGFAGTRHTPGESERKATPATPAGPEAGATVGSVTKAYGNDPNQSYTMRHELVDMGDIQASNTASGGINPKYDATLQPRDRSRESSQAQIAQVAQNMNPEVMTTDFHRIDAGTPIIDKQGNVLSGNGRTLALQRAAEMHPEKYDAYKAAIKAEAKAAGIDPAAVDRMKNPVLVRRLEGEHDAAAFAREANSSGTLRMSPLEQAKVDAGQISNKHMLKLNVTEGGDIDRALRDKSNKPFIDDFLAGVPANERANLLTRNGELNQMGLYRVKAAVYTRAFPGAHGERMAESMLESLDPDVKTIQNGISGALPDFSRATALTRSGLRDPHLDISDDLAKTIDVYARIKDNPHLTAGTPAHQLVSKYLGQSTMFDRELNAEQERLLVHIDKIARKPTEVRSFLQKYAKTVENQPQPGQSSLFGEGDRLTRAQLYDLILGDTAPPVVDTQAGMF